MKLALHITALLLAVLASAAHAATVPAESVGVYRDKQGTIHTQELPTGERHYSLGINGSGVAYYSTSYNVASTTIGATDSDSGAVFSDIQLLVEYRVDPNQIAELRIAHPPEDRVVLDAQKRITPAANLLSRELNLLGRKNAKTIATSITSGDRATLSETLQSMMQDLQSRLNNPVPLVYVRNITLNEGGFTINVDSIREPSIPHTLAADQVSVLQESKTFGIGTILLAMIPIALVTAIVLSIFKGKLFWGTSQDTPAPLPSINEQTARLDPSGSRRTHELSRRSPMSQQRQQEDSLRGRVNERTSTEKKRQSEPKSIQKNKRKLAIDD
ncbi:MAG: hypothetical protein ACR2PS_03080 [Pseudomonadales bacterium]